MHTLFDAVQGGALGASGAWERRPDSPSAKNGRYRERQAPQIAPALAPPMQLQHDVASGAHSTRYFLGHAMPGSKRQGEKLSVAWIVTQLARNDVMGAHELGLERLTEERLRRPWLLSEPALHVHGPPHGQGRLLEAESRAQNLEAPGGLAGSSHG